MTIVACYSNATDDGRVSGSSTVWNTARTTGSASNSTDTTCRLGADYGLGGPTTYRAFEMFLDFDTTGTDIPDTATLTYAEIVLTITLISNDDIEQMRFSFTTGWGTLAAADFVSGDNVAALDVFCEFPISDFSSGADTAFGNNGTLAGISKTGVTSILGFVRTIESSATAPAGDNHIVANSSDAAGTADDPVLNVTYIFQQPRMMHHYRQRRV